MFRKDYNKIITENFDIDDRETRKVLLNLNEGDQNSMLLSLASKLYDNIVDKIDDIDFGTIPNSKGDVTKIDNYDKLVNCINLMQDLLKEYKQDTNPIDVICTALGNIRARKDIFEKGFRYNNELIISVYDTITLAVVSSVSLMISSCVDFIKTPTENDFKISLNNVALNRTKDNLLFDNLNRFNKSCNNGSMDKSLEFVLKNVKNNLLGFDDMGVVLTGVAAATLILNILPILRELIFFFYSSRCRVSDYFEVQANLIQMNALNVQSNDLMKKNERERISKKQMKISDLFRKISNFVAVNIKHAEKETTKEVSGDNKKYKANEVVKTMPDSASSSSALF